MSKFVWLSHGNVPPPADGGKDDSETTKDGIIETQLGLGADLDTAVANAENWENRSRSDSSGSGS